MKNPLHRCIFLFSICLLFLLLVACNYSGGGNPAPANSPDASATAIFQTLEAQSAEMTAQAQGAAQPTEAVAQPAETSAPAQTEPPAASPVAPGEAVTVTVTAKINTNCRSGPSKNYPKISNLGADLRAIAQGKDSTGKWLYIQNNKKSGGSCWVSTSTLNVDGDITRLPVIEAGSLSAAQTQAAQTLIPQAPVAPANPTPQVTPSP